MLLNAVFHRLNKIKSAKVRAAIEHSNKRVDN